MSSRRGWLSALAGFLLLSDGKFALAASDTSGKETDDDLFIASTKTLKVGTVASPGVLTKTLRVPFAECLPVVESATWFCGAGYIRPNALNAATDYEAAVLMPKGVTLTAFKARMYRQTASDNAVAVLRRGADDGTQTALVTLTDVTNGAWVTMSGALSELVGDALYRFSVSLKAVSANTDARLMWFELEYTVPDYSKGI